MEKYKIPFFICTLVLLAESHQAYEVVSESQLWKGLGTVKNLQVQTANGAVKGFLGRTCRSDMEFAGFRGIPYAEPPVGELRFKAPVEKTNWEGVYDATYQRPGCMQGAFDNEKALTNDTFSEDCLFLNVYTPNLKYLQNSKAPLKPVMVFIHGGAFLMGSSSESIQAPDFLVEKDVVLVTLNYRLGAFGFLSLQTPEVPGNAGLKDQSLALRWVQKNIRAFGGDPNKVTIFGESAGSASVNFHLLSSMSAGLFQGAIMESGSVLSSWAYTTPEVSLQKATKLAGDLKCKKRAKGKELLACLQKVSADVLAQTQQKVLTVQDLSTMNVIAFAPTTEPNVPGAFLTDYPYQMMFAGNFTKVPVIMGSNSDEGLLLYPVFQDNALGGLLLTLLSMDWSRLAPAQLKVKPMSVAALKVHQAISKFYFNDKSVNKVQTLKVLELIGDVNFLLPIQLATSLIAEHSRHPVYNYQFSYDGGYAVYKASANMQDVQGVSHADELGYLFYTPGFHKNCAKSKDKMDVAPLDELMIERMTEMWSNFAKTGNPTSSLNKFVTTKWDPFTNRVGRYMDIGEDMVMSNELKITTITFWQSVVSEIVKNRDLVEQELNASDLMMLGW